MRAFKPRSVAVHAEASCEPRPARMKHLRLLALHSFRTSGAIFRQQVALSRLDKELEDLIELVYVDAPHAASGLIPQDVAGVFEGPFYEWWSADKNESGEYVYRGSQESVQFLTDFIRQHGPIDGLFAFSQGGAIAAILLAMQRQGALLTDVPPLRCAVIFAGIKSRDARFRQYLDGPPIDVPAVHVIGERDYVRGPAKQLLGCFRAPVLIEHPRGHVIPRLEGEELHALRTFLAAHQQPGSAL